jgi:hypothetical protein
VTKTDADVWLTMKEAEIHRGDWIDPDAGKILFGTYADTWMHDHVLKPRTDELYRGLLKNHLKPTFGRTDLGKIREETSGAGARNASTSAPSRRGRSARSPSQRHTGCCTAS